MLSPAAKVEMREFYDLAFQQAWLYLARITGGDIALTEDLIQDVMLSVAKDLARGRSPKHVGGQEELYTTSGSITFQGPATRTDGAMLDLTTKTWTKIAKAPVPLNNADVAQWDGKEVITLAADGSTAAFDPTSNTWRALAPVPFGKGSRRLAAWTGTELLVTGGYGPLPDASGGLKPNPKAAAYRPNGQERNARHLRAAGPGTGRQTLPP